MQESQREAREVARNLAILAIIVLLGTALTVGVIFTDGNGGGVFLLLFWATWALALTLGVLSAVVSSRQHQPVWSGVYVVATAVGLGGTCAGLADVVGHMYSGFATPMDAKMVLALMLVPLSATPLATLLYSVPVLRRGKSTLSAPADLGAPAPPPGPPL